MREEGPVIEKLQKWSIGGSVAICLLLLAAATGVSYILHELGLPDTNIVLVYMVGVLIASSITDGFFYGVMESVLAMVAFNYFFISPYYSLDVDSPDYVFAIGIMLLTAVITSMVTSKAKITAKEAGEREQETTSMLKLTNQIAEASCMEEIAAVVVEHTSQLLKCNTSYLAAEDGKLSGRILRQTAGGLQVWEDSLECEKQQILFEESDRKEYVDSKMCRDWPIYGQNGLLGVLRIPLERGSQIETSQMRMLNSIKETACLALDRLCVLNQQMKDNAIMERERYKATLLRSISHDLRTPLTGIMGTAEILLDMTGEGKPENRLIKDIYQDAEWLYELVENVLSLTRLQNGAPVHKEKEACEEVIDAAVQRIQGRIGKRKIQVQVPEECLELNMDAKLIGQVLLNMLDNAVRYTSEDGAIWISVRKDSDEAIFEIMDSGNGISEKDLANIFQLFYTANGENGDKIRGTGIGLAICEAIVKAHGGTIYAGNREEGDGAVFRFTIPIEREDFD